METGRPFHFVRDVPKMCEWIATQPADRFTTPDEQLGGADYGSLTLSEAIEVLPRAFRHGEIAQDDVDAVLDKLTHNLSADDAAILITRYADELRLQKEANGES